MLTRDRFHRCAAALLLLLGGNFAHAAENAPRWEIGLGVATLTVPDYRGSREQGQYALPLPYLSYTGDVLAVDREGVRGELFRSERLRLEASISAAPPSKSETGARTDMAELDPVIEAGPSLSIRLDSDSTNRWSLNFPLRAAIATDLRHVETIGWIFSPHIKFSVGNGGWRYDVSAGPMYASEEYHDYYYQVAPEHATPGRPAFDASAGYSGSRITFTMSKHFGRFWAGVFARYDYLAGAAFRDSPLVETDHAFMAGAGIAWILARSAQVVPTDR